MSLSDDDDELDLLGDMHNIPVPMEPKQPFQVGDNVRIAMTRRTLKKDTLVNGLNSYLSWWKTSYDSNHMQGKGPC